MKIIHSKKTKQFFLASFIPLTLLAVVSSLLFANITSRMVSEQVQKETIASMERLSSEVQALLQTNITNVENFVNLAEQTDDKEIRNSIIHSLAKNLIYSYKIYYATREDKWHDGYWIDSVDWVPADTYDWTQRGWFKAAGANPGKMCYIDPYIAASTGKACISLSQSVGDGLGGIQGVASLDMNIDEFGNLLNDSRVSEHSKIYIVTGDGTYMAHEDESKVLKANYFDETALKARAGEHLTAGAKVRTEGGMFYGSTKIGDSPWFIVAEGPVSDFTRSIRIQSAAVTVLLSILCLGGAVFLSLFMLNIQKNEHRLGEKLIGETQSLSVAAKENAATSQDQSAAVKEIVATMEDNNALAETIAKKITDVSGVAGKTNGSVHEGVALLSRTVEQLSEIAGANQTTIDGIKSLGEKIENIWDIVTLINSVADQAKIIAFNAELEASSAGEAGKNFHIVATEIRRLADGIIDGTKEIKERINEIQQSSDSLILASENGTAKINEGREGAKALEAKFAGIKDASEITVQSAGDITGIVRQQTAASEQILATLRQIALGIENFTQATESISNASENLRVIAEDLNK